MQNRKKNENQAGGSDVVHSYWEKWQQGYDCYRCNWWADKKVIITNWDEWLAVHRFNLAAKAEGKPLKPYPKHTYLKECPCCGAIMDLDRVHRVKVVDIDDT